MGRLGFWPSCSAVLIKPGVACGAASRMKSCKPPSSIASLLLCAVAIGVLLMFPAAGHGAQIINNQGGYIVRHPRGWRAELNRNRVSLVKGRVHRGMRYPRGGALILIQAFPPWDHPTFQRESSDEANLTALATGQVISQTPATGGQWAKLTDLQPGVVRTTWCVRHIEDHAFLVSVSCSPDDPKAPKYDDVMDRIVAGITLVNTPGPTRTPHHKAPQHRKIATHTPARE